MDRNTEQIEAIIQRINEIRQLFKTTSEVLPFIADLLQFLKDLMPIITETNLSIVESTQNLPTASHRIADVSQTTEMATQTILDKLDVISARLESMRQDLPTARQQDIAEIQDDIAHIIYALQFQDITAQKLEHANRILQTIYEKFLTLFQQADELKTTSQVGKKFIDDLNGSTQEAEMQRKRQNLREKMSDTVRQQGISQDDIDQFFK